MTAVGSYAILRVGDYELFWSKGYVDPTVATIFAESDGRIELASPEGDPDEQSLKRIYRCTLEVARDRLDILGFTEVRARLQYERWLADEIASIQQQLDPGNDDFYESLRDHYLGRLVLLQSLAFDSWLSTFRSLVERGLQTWHRDELHLTTAERFILGEEESWFGYPLTDPRFFLRSALLAFPVMGQLELDVSDLVVGGYFAADDTVVANARHSLIENIPNDRKIILVTEGSTDIGILRCAIENIAPHLSDYFTFFDFHGTRARGGASAAVDTIKAFAAAKVYDRIIALLDNDTAAHAALRALANVELPGNIRYLTYPDIDIARTYPTLGPSGLTTMNVNGLAGSIEMYLGSDVLTTSEQILTPVQWRGFDESLRRYQGELLNKSALRDRFFEHVAEWRECPERHEERDWSGLVAILDRVRQVARD